MNSENPIVVDPEIMSGTPVFRGTRVPVYSLFEHLRSNYTVSDFVELFPTVSRKDVLAVLERTQTKVIELNRP